MRRSSPILESQAFERDGGGGSATIYRRFGAYPVHDMPEEKVLSDMMREFEPIDMSAHKNLDFLKPLWAIGGRPVCESEDELGVKGAPSRCTLVPTDMRVISRGLGGFPWQNVKVRFVDTDTAVIEGWMASSDLRN
jgi:hypothetical protein